MSPTLTRELILLIDHEPSVRAVVQTCLKHLGGWNVVAVSSPNEALMFLASAQPDAILLDVPRIEIEGYRFIKNLTQNPTTCHIPVVLFTARAEWFSPQQLQNLGVLGAIAKPFEVDRLPNQIAGFFNWPIYSRNP